MNSNSICTLSDYFFRYSAGTEAHILWSAGISSVLELKQLVNRLNNAGYATMDISNVKEALDFLRGFVGGKARCYMGEVPHERVLKVGSDCVIIFFRRL